MIITVELSAALDADIRGAGSSRDGSGGNATQASREFRELLAAQGLKPVPLFPDAGGAVFGRIWHIACPDKDAAGLVEKLLRMSSVEAAYVKPVDDLPGSP